MSETGWRVARVAEIAALPPTDDPAFWEPWAREPGFGSGWHSIGRQLGVTAFGVNASEAKAGGELIVPHDETEFGGQEELYVVVHGLARFTCDGETVELAPGDVLLCGPAVAREAVALETPTLVVMVGGTPGAAYETPDWNAG